MSKWERAALLMLGLIVEALYDIEHSRRLKSPLQTYRERAEKRIRAVIREADSD